DLAPSSIYTLSLHDALPICERHIIHFYTEFLSKQFVPDGTDIFAEALELLFGIITRPALADGSFREDYLAQEKENLRIRIEGRRSEEHTSELQSRENLVCRL